MTTNKLVWKASSVAGMELDMEEEVTEKSIRGKLKAIIDSPSTLS